MKLTSLKELASLSIAHTDTGDYFIYEGTLKKEFFVEGMIIRARAGLFIIEIEEQEVSFKKTRGFQIGEPVICQIEASLKDNSLKCIILSLLKK
jgi:hypothetical protein